MCLKKKRLDFLSERRRWELFHYKSSTFSFPLRVKIKRSPHPIGLTCFTILCFFSKEEKPHILLPRLFFCLSRPSIFFPAPLLFFFLPFVWLRLFLLLCVCGLNFFYIESSLVIKLGVSEFGQPCLGELARAPRDRPGITKQATHTQLEKLKRRKGKVLSSRIWSAQTLSPLDSRNFHFDFLNEWTTFRPPKKPVGRVWRFFFFWNFCFIFFFLRTLDCLRCRPRNESGLTVSEPEILSWEKMMTKTTISCFCSPFTGLHTWRQKNKKHSGLLHIVVMCARFYWYKKKKSCCGSAAYLRLRFVYSFTSLSPSSERRKLKMKCKWNNQQMRQ